MDNSKSDAELNEKNNNIKFKKVVNFWKLKRGSNYNAFHRKNLGSIPSKFDNFIFKLPEESKSNLTSTLQPHFRNNMLKYDRRLLKKYGSGNSVELSGNSIIFSVNNSIKSIKKNKSVYDLSNLESFKTVYSETNNSTLQSAINNKENKEKDLMENKFNIFDKIYQDENYEIYLTRYNKNNSLLKTKFNKEDRYNNIYYKNNILNKYYPGPGDYEIVESTMSNQKNPFRYDSLFKSKSTFSLIELKDNKRNLGPGYYNIFKKKEIHGGTFSTSKKYNYLNNPSSSKEEYTFNLGPGAIDLPSAFNIKEKDKLNYFFVQSPEKEENLERKYGIERGNTDKNLEEFKDKIRWFDKEKTKDFNNDWINKNLERKINEEKRKGNIIDFNGLGNDTEKKNIKQDVFYWARMANDEIKKGQIEAMKRKGAYSFSKIPKLIHESNHVPGPAYYDSDKILKGIKLKKELNANVNLNWI